MGKGKGKKNRDDDWEVRFCGCPIAYVCHEISQLCELLQVSCQQLVVASV